MTIKQKIEISDFLKGILRNLRTSNTDDHHRISQPVFIFDSEEKEGLLIEIISDLEKEICEEEKKP